MAQKSEKGLGRVLEGCEVSQPFRLILIIFDLNIKETKHKNKTKIIIQVEKITSILFRFVNNNL